MVNLLNRILLKLDPDVDEDDDLTKPMDTTARRPESPPAQANGKSA
ncbi:MAG: hypothetical protein ACRDZ8_06240 [Acidimicrobiales bacterium]